MGGKVRGEVGGMGSTLLAVPSSYPGYGLYSYDPPVYIWAAKVSSATSFEHDVGPPRFQVSLRRSLRQMSDHIKDFLVVVPKSGLWIRVRGRQAGDVAVVLLVRRMQ